MFHDPWALVTLENCSDYGELLLPGGLGHPLGVVEITGADVEMIVNEKTIYTGGRQAVIVTELLKYIWLSPGSQREIENRK